MDKGLRRLIDHAVSSRLCYGEPIREGDRTVIPVARVRVTGGWGFGRGKSKREEGGGGAGALDARPAGFIEVGPEGARFHPIRDPEQARRVLRTGAAAIATVLGGVAGARRLSAGRRRRPAGLLRPGGR